MNYIKNYKDKYIFDKRLYKFVFEEVVKGIWGLHQKKKDNTQIELLAKFPY